MQKLSKVVSVDEQKCVNCHACILACPVKFCNDGSGDSVKINDDMCIGCGACIDACKHAARKITDDSEKFFKDIRNGEKIIAIVAPAIAANFPGKYLNKSAEKITQIEAISKDLKDKMRVASMSAKHSFETTNKVHENLSTFIE